MNDRMHEGAAELDSPPFDRSYYFENSRRLLEDPTFVMIDERTMVDAIEGRFDANEFPEGSPFADARSAAVLSRSHRGDPCRARPWRGQSTPSPLRRAH